MGSPRRKRKCAAGKAAKQKQRGGQQLVLGEQYTRPTWRQLSALYAAEWVPHLRPHTRDGYRTKLRWLDAHLPDWPTGGEVLALCLAQVQQGRWGAAYANHHLDLVGAVYRFGSQRWPLYLVPNPTERTPRIPEPERLPRTLPGGAGAFATLLEAAPDARARALFGVLRWQGVRISEALGFEMRPKEGLPHVDLAAGLLRVTQQRAADQGLKTRDPKTAASAATLHLAPQAADLIRLALRERMTSGELPRGKRAARFLFPYVATCDRCRPVRKAARKEGRDLQDALLRDGCAGRQCLRALIEVVRKVMPGVKGWHDFRHSFAADLQATVRNSREAQLALRHASLDITERYYRPVGGVSPTVDRGVMERAWAHSQPQPADVAGAAAEPATRPAEGAR